MIFAHISSIFNSSIIYPSFLFVLCLIVALFMYKTYQQRKKYGLYGNYGSFVFFYVLLIIATFISIIIASVYGGVVPMVLLYNGDSVFGYIAAGIAFGVLLFFVAHVIQMFRFMNHFIKKRRYQTIYKFLKWTWRSTAGFIALAAILFLTDAELLDTFLLLPLVVFPILLTVFSTSYLLSSKRVFITFPKETIEVLNSQLNPEKATKNIEQNIQQYFQLLKTDEVLTHCAPDYSLNQLSVRRVQLAYALNWFAIFLMVLVAFVSTIGLLLGSKYATGVIVFWFNLGAFAIWCWAGGISQLLVKRFVPYPYLAKRKHLELLEKNIA